MINTYDIKKQQLEQGAFKVGSGPETMLIMGSCRSVPYLNYLNEVNKVDNKFSIYFIDPFNWNWDKKDNRVDYDQVLKTLETNKYLLDIISSTKIFIHEYYKNFGMFNTIEDGDKNIYDFGMKPEVDVCIPNFNDVFVMVNDLYQFDTEIKKKIDYDIKGTGVISQETQILCYETSKNNLERFYAVCRMSDVSEMEEYFKENFTKVRLFWTYNHISKGFAMFIFKTINEKFLKLNISESVWNKIEVMEDMYANRYTFLTEYDLKFYDYKLNEEIKTFTI
jgi:hypothetical protein